jgi:uncharacterized protein YwqG
MPKLLIQAKAGNALEPATQFGGIPLAPPHAIWPRCSSCGGPMQFLAQLQLSDLDAETWKADPGLLLIFQCQNSPGMCDEWDPNSGGNAAIIVHGNTMTPMAVPTLTPEEIEKGLSGETLLSKVDGVLLQEYDGSLRKNSPDDAYCDALENSDLVVLGKIGGQPLWIQGDETPQCSCGNKMTFLMQLECVGAGGINFGDMGSGYAFACQTCKDKAKFLWQCY